MSVNQPYHKELLSRVAGGDTKAFHQLVLIHKDTIYTAAVRLMQNRERAEDCVQDIFMKIWLRRETLPSIENFDAWLHTVTHNTLLSALKRLAREKLEELPDEGDFPVRERTVEDLLTQKEYANLLERAIAALSDRQRQVYHLVKVTGLSREEAAHQIGISLDTIKFHLTEATRRIRAFVMKNGDISLLILFLIKNN